MEALLKLAKEIGGNNWEIKQQKFFSSNLFCSVLPKRKEKMDIIGKDPAPVYSPNTIQNWP